MSLWYPTYVEQINDRAEADRFYGASCNATISDLVLSTTQLARLSHCSSTSYRNVTFDRAEFTGWTFSDASLTSSVFKGCVFNRVSFQKVNFSAVHFVNGSSTELLFDSVVLNTTDFCRFNASHPTSLNSLVIDTVVNGRGVGNQTALLEALVEGLPPPTACSFPPAGSVYSPTSDKYQVYRESFFVAGSALPGNVLSAVAVYFLRRNYWLGALPLQYSLHLFTLTLTPPINAPYIDPHTHINPPDINPYTHIPHVISLPLFICSHYQWLMLFHEHQFHHLASVLH